MRKIHKQAEPAFMRELRERIQPEDGEDWKKLTSDEKAAMRTALLTEQGGLCAYCMTRLRDVGYDAQAFPNGTKIEHHEPRSTAPTCMLDWSNLLAVCGGEQPSRHCDGSRTEDATLPLHPARVPPNVDDLFCYPTDPRGGRVVAVVDAAAAANAEAATATLRELRLNDIAHLRENRDSAIDAVDDLLRDDDSRARLLKLYAAATTATVLAPFAGAVAWHLRRKLRRHGVAVPT